MKPQVYKFTIILACLFALPCSIAVFGDSPSDVSSYYPINLGNQWTYNVISQQKVTAKIAIRVGRPEAGYLKLNYYYSESPSEIPTYYSYSQFFTRNEQGLLLIKDCMYTGATINYTPPQPLLTANFNVGTTWSWVSNNNKKFNFIRKVISSEKISIKGKTFDSLLVQSKGIDEKGEYSNKNWYVKGIGLVKQVLTHQEKNPNPNIGSQNSDMNNTIEVTSTLMLDDYTIKNKN